MNGADPSGLIGDDNTVDALIVTATLKDPLQHLDLQLSDLKINFNIDINVSVADLAGLNFTGSKCDSEASCVSTDLDGVTVIGAKHPTLTGVADFDGLGGDTGGGGVTTVSAVVVSPTTTHHYTTGATAHCPAAAASVFNIMRAISAPGAPYAMAGTHIVDLLPYGEGNKIIQTVDPSTMTITNVALPTHMFQGTVTIQITQNGDNVSVSVNGVGAGPEAPEKSIFNDAVGLAYFGWAANTAVQTVCGGQPA